MATPGQFLGVRINGVFTSCETSCTINFGVDMLPASAVDSEGWKEFIAGIRTWSIGVDANLLLEVVSSDIKSLITTAFINRLPIFVEFATRPSVEIQLVLSGACLLSAGSITAPVKGNATWNITLQGTGALTTQYQDFDLLIDAMPSLADYPIIVDEDQ